MRVALTTRNRPDRRGEVPVYVRLQHGRTYYLGLGVRLKARDWNPRRQEVRPSYGVGADDLNDHLAERLATAREAAQAVLFQRGVTVDGEAVRAAVEAALRPEAPTPAPGFLAFWADRIEAHRSRGRVSTAYAYGSALASFRRFLAREGRSETTLEAGHVTAALARRYVVYLSDAPPTGEGHAPGYVAKQLGVLRWALSRAVEAGHEGAAVALAAASSVKVRRERAERPRLTPEQVAELAALPLFGRQADARDWWLFAFYAGGLRFSDVCRLRWANVRRGADGAPTGIAFQQTKTGGRVSLPLAPPAAAILTRWEPRTGPAGRHPSVYVFGLITEADEAAPHTAEGAARLRAVVGRRGALARKMLSQIADRQGWPRFGTHAARHAFALTMVQGGASLYSVSKALGHASLRVTDAYLRGFDEEAVGREMLAALGSLPAPPEPPV